jgi:hypothetical protein
MEILSSHRSLLQYVIREAGYDPQVLRLLSECEAIIGSIIFLDQVQLAVPHIQRVEEFRAQGTHGDDIHASALFTATEALKALLAGNDPPPPAFTPPVPHAGQSEPLTKVLEQIKTASKPQSAAPKHSAAPQTPASDPTDCSVDDVWPPETRVDSLIDFFGGDRYVSAFHLAYGSPKKPPEIFICTRCDGKAFNVAQGFHGDGYPYTAIRCMKCKWEKVIQVG